MDGGWASRVSASVCLLLNEERYGKKKYLIFLVVEIRDWVLVSTEHTVLRLAPFSGNV